MNNFQREGSISNSHVGREFESIAQNHLTEIGIPVHLGFSIPIGINTKKKHVFDLGCDNPKVIVECKSHRWTSGNNVPSAKMTVWNEVMYYFSLVSDDYRKIMFVLRDYSPQRKETLTEYYLRNHHHLIPSSVEFWEYNSDTNQVIQTKK